MLDLAASLGAESKPLEGQVLGNKVSAQPVALEAWLSPVRHQLCWTMPELLLWIGQSVIQSLAFHLWPDLCFCYHLGKRKDARSHLAWDRLM